MRMPCEYCGAWPLARSCSLTWGRKPWTSTMRTPMAWIIARSWAMLVSLPASMASPVMPTTKVWLRNLWIYGATERNQGTKVKLKTVDMGGEGGRRDGKPWATNAAS
ncbi:hypothetical protein D3C71_1616500 [compost metagenome]